MYNIYWIIDSSLDFHTDIDVLVVSKQLLLWKNTMTDTLCEYRYKTQLVLSKKTFPVAMRKLEKKQQQDKFY